MKKTLLTILGLAALTIASSSAATLLEFDFAGSTSTATYNTQSSTFSATNVLSSSMTRGTGISTNNANNSFRGTGFSNNGISLSNTDYFQFTITAATGYTLALESIYGNFNGTTTFSASPGVTMAYAYSLDSGATFTLMSSFVQVGSGNYTYTISGTDATALTDVSSVTFRLYASGQTTTGGWGLQSAASAGTIGLRVSGTTAEVIPEPATAVLFGIGAMAVIFRRRMARK